MTTDDYVALLTSEHRSQPNFEATVRTMTQGFADSIDMLRGLLAQFDLDVAVGDQLDTIGLWVGVTRRVPVPIADVFFTWDGTVATGWKRGQWKGLFDPAEGIVSLSDSDFRLFIRAKIAVNAWNGTAEQMADILAFLFGEGAVVMRDNQDMTIRVIYDDSALSSVQAALLTNDLLLLRPAGVLVTYETAV
jgi:hypothetical protein